MVRSILSVADADVSMIQSKVYDLHVFASGFESRCTSIPQLLRRAPRAIKLVLGFHEHRDNESRKRADAFYQEELGCEPVLVPTAQPGSVAQLISEYLPGFNDTIRREEYRILVDISSMSRSWYADLINWARFAPGDARVQIDFCYTAGIYPDPYPPRMISEITSLFGFEGHSDLRLETVAFLGLGYDAVTPHAVLEDLQPELTYGYIAGSPDELSILNALKVNAATIGDLDGPVAVVPLLSVEAAYGVLSDMIAPHAGNRNVVFVSLGPKTHVLAGLLVAAKNEEVTCLHVRGRSMASVDIKASAEVAVCSVMFGSFYLRTERTAKMQELVD